MKPRPPYLRNVYRSINFDAPMADAIGDAARAEERTVAEWMRGVLRKELRARGYTVPDEHAPLKPRDT